MIPTADVNEESNNANTDTSDLSFEIGLSPPLSWDIGINLHLANEKAKSNGSYRDAALGLYKQF